MDSMKNWKKWLKLASLVAVISTQAFQTAATAKETAKSMKSVRTYMSFAKAVDPACILTMADLELSIALATPLVVFNDERQVVSGLAERWTIQPPDRIAFSLRQNLKWSDGSVVKASEYKAALERARKMYGDDLKAFFDVVAKIEAPDDRTLVFTTISEVAKSGILLKLTEPMYGLVALKNGSLDLSKSAGPFVVNENESNRLTLLVNQNWYAFVKEMPERVEIKRPMGGADLVTSFEKDEWPNLTSGRSLMRQEAMEHLKKNGFKTWQRSLDKVYGIFPSKRFLEADGGQFIKAVAGKLNRAILMNGLVGYADAEQFFPRGYELFSPKPAKPETVSDWKREKPVHVIVPETSTWLALRENFLKAMNQSGGVKLQIETIPSSEMGARMKRGDFDILVSTLAVADPNFEGAMSFFIEKEPPFIQSMKGANDFAGQLRAARGLPTSDERASRMREIIVRAQEAGHVLPLFHFSSLAIAKPGIDLSGIPNSDETVLFSKVRMK